MPAPSTTPIHPLVRSFLRSTRWAPTTKRVGGWALGNWAAWLERRGVKLTDAEPEDVEAYLAQREAGGLAPATRRSDWKAIRAFYRWALTEGEVDRNPARAIAGPIDHETPVVVITEDEHRAMLATCNRRTTIGRRDEAILGLLWWAGLRRGEITGLDRAGADVEAERLTVGSATFSTKSRKVRKVPLAAEAVDALERYLRRRDDAEPALFVSQRGERLGVGGLTEMVQRRAERAGLGRRVGLHEYRRAFAVRHKRRGGSDPALMALAGWTSITMVSRYTRMEAEGLAEEEFRRLIDDSAPRRRRTPRRRAS